MTVRTTRRLVLTVALALAAASVVPATAGAAAAAPTITGISPTSGPVGTPVTVTGSGFSAPATVVFTGATVPLTGLRSSTSLGVAVPGGASSGTVSVRFPNGTVVAGRFTVTVGIVVGPRSGAPGSSTTVKGSGYAAGEKVSLTTGGTTLARGVRASATGTISAAVVVPAGTALGPVTITATGVTSGRTSHATYSVGWDWPSEGGDPANTRWNPFESVLTPTAVAAGLAARWTYFGSRGGGTTLEGAGPAVAGGRAFVETLDNRLHAVDASTGAELWSVALGSAYPTTPDVVGDVVYAVGSQDLTARDVATGALRWRASVPSSAAVSPVVAGGRVFVGDVAGNFLCFDAATGHRLWTIRTHGSFFAPAAVAGDTVYTGAEDGVLRALDVATGATRWTATSGSASGFQSGFLGTPAVAGGLVYAIDTGGTLFALRATDGRTVWSAAVGDNGLVSAPAVADGVVYTSSHQYEVRALDARTGHLLWSRRNTSVQDRTPSAPTVAGGVVYLVSPDDVIEAYDARHGTPLWRHDPGGNNGSGVAAPVVSNGLVYVTGSYARLVAFGRPG